MLREAEGNLLDADTDALVNAVNTAGVMGKGIALQFKQAYPGNFQAYAAACRRGEVQLGRMFVFETGLPGHPRLIINFPTKGHWRARSKLDDISAGLADLNQAISAYQITSIAIPALGCGNGGLDWGEVRTLIIDALGGLPGVEVVIYPPEEVPSTGPAKPWAGTPCPPAEEGVAGVVAKV